MKFCYIDESGTPEVPGNTSHYVLAGLTIPVDKWKFCEMEVNKIKKKYQLDNAEIHAGWLLWPITEQGKIKDFDKLDSKTRIYEVQKYRTSELLRLQTSPTPQKTKQYHRTKKNYRLTKEYIHLTLKERRQFVFEIAKMIGGWSFCRLFAESIDKIHFNPAIAKSSIDEQAFEQLVSRFEQYLKFQKPVECGLIIHDNNDTVKKKHTDLMKKFHQTGTFWTTIHNIIETPLFVDSQLTSMIQLADVCSYSIRRYLEKGETDLFNEVFKVADKLKSGKVVGIRHFTAHTCTCIICKAHKDKPLSSVKTVK